MSISFFGIRHHGPGCARCLISALETLEPDAILVEGPPDAQEMIDFMKSDNLVPPVALLIYPLDRPQDAVYYPFTVFSPEWQALRYALKSGIPARFMDLPQAFRMEKKEVQDDKSEAEPESSRTSPKGMKEHDSNAAGTEEAEGTEAVDGPEKGDECGLIEDPFRLVARAAGYEDSELWWEHQIEQRREGGSLFEAIAHMMTALRAEADRVKIDPQDARREAFMRESIRKAEKEGFRNIAVICGAWHVPALSRREDAGSDLEILKHLEPVEVRATWIPWTNSRLSYKSGYGAGIYSPGWYGHLWAEPEKAPIRWVVRAAQLLRAQDLDASSASVIETVRLADALAALRELPMPGLKELSQAIQSVLCFGNDAPMRLIREKLEIGEAMGHVPPETPMVPLQRDIETLQHKLRMKPTTEIEDWDLDLRKETDRARSLLLHRLRMLGVEWGRPVQVQGKKGTFHELWQTKWDVTYTVNLIEANIWGNTVESAATGYACHKADQTQEISVLTELLDQSILAQLPQATEYLLSQIQSKSALSHDVGGMMASLPPLARVARYGNVRGTRTDEVLKVFYGLFERISIGLPGACFSLDDDASRNMVERIASVQESLEILNEAELKNEWREVLQKLLKKDAVHGLVRGWCCRILLEQRSIDEEELERLARINLSPVNPRIEAAFWVEGLLKGSAVVLIHQDGLWRVMDRWVSSLGKEEFVEILPLLRRAFCNFSAPERRAMGEKIKGLGDSPRAKIPGTDTSESLEVDRADRVLPVLGTILGVELKNGK